MVTVIGQSRAAVKQCTCKHCGAVLEFLPRDVKEHHGKDYSGGPDGHKWVDCPQCNNKVIIESW